MIQLNNSIIEFQVRTSENPKLKNFAISNHQVMFIYIQTHEKRNFLRWIIEDDPR